MSKDYDNKIKRQQNGALYRMSAKQQRKVNALIKSDCSNYYDGTCLELDDGESVGCVQAHSSSLCCTYFQNAVLPMDEALEAEILQDHSVKCCEVCGQMFVPKSNRAKYCPDCAAKVHRKQKTEYERNKRKNMDI